MDAAVDFSKTDEIVLPKGNLNTQLDIVTKQVNENIRRGLPQVQPHQVNNNTVLLVCSGPSLKYTEKELVRLYWEGGKIVAVNGAYQWCIDHNLKPSAAIILDARDFNERFIAESVPGCKYFLASQCHPKLFDLCQDRETYIWHACSGGDEEHELLKKYYFDNVCPIDGGTTVGIRAISLMRMLGFQYFEIFGLDSCIMDGDHHAFDQPENKDKGIIVWLRPKGFDEKAQRFICAPWHMKQAEDFQNLIRKRGDLFKLNVHGDGLISAILRTGAEIEKETENGC